MSIVNYGVSKHYTGSMVSDRCPLGYLFHFHRIFKKLTARGGFNYECITKENYFSTKMYVVGTQKNRLNETVLLGTKNIYMLKIMCKKIFTVLG